MAKVTYLLKKNKYPAKIYTRFRNGRQLDLVSSKLPYSINPNCWSQRKQKIKDHTEILDRHTINDKLIDLNKELVKQFNIDYSNGITIDKKWLDENIDSFFNVVKKDDRYKVYLTSYLDHFMEVSVPKRVHDKTGEPLAKSTIKAFQNCVNNIKDFEAHAGKRFKLMEVDLEFKSDFVLYMKNEKNLSNRNTVGSVIKRLRTILHTAKDEGIEVNQAIDSSKFSLSTQPTLDTYLNESEISKIVGLDLSNNERLDNARDWLIIGVWTGLRVSDLLTIKKINGEEIRLTTKKTKQDLVIPVLEPLKKVLKKRKGKLPRKISDDKFNRYIKEVAKLAGLTERIQGALRNPITNRKELGEYEKWRLVSSHICRRSFSTNNYGKMPNAVIMSATGHTSETQFLKYLKKTKEENAEVMRRVWKD